MLDMKNVVYKRKNKWYVGVIKDDKINRKKKIEKLKDVTSTDDYVTIKKFLKDNKIKIESDEIMDKLKVQNLYIKVDKVVKPKINKDVKKKTRVVTYRPTEEEWWSEKNSDCLQCTHKCKQSKYVEIVSCKRMEMING
jgi:hypothetical protein